MGAAWPSQTPVKLCKLVGGTQHPALCAPSRMRSVISEISDTYSVSLVRYQYPFLTFLRCQVLLNEQQGVLVLLELMSQGEKGSGDGGVLLASVVDVTKEGFRFQER